MPRGVLEFQWLKTRVQSAEAQQVASCCFREQLAIWKRDRERSGRERAAAPRRQGMALTGVHGPKMLSRPGRWAVVFVYKLLFTFSASA